MLKQARAAFVELGAHPWVERTDAAERGENTATEQTALPA
jgi:hypothetical protein